MSRPACFAFGILCFAASAAHADLRDDARAAMRQAIAFYHGQVATEGGYLYRYSADLKLREGEGVADDRTVWVQPPGTPAVGLAMLEAWQRTGDETALAAARHAADALIRGQLHTGGWTNMIHFNPQARRRFAYRIDGEPGKKARNVSTLDDNISQSAARFLMRLDRALDFKDARVHEAARFALGSIVRAQYASGAWPQGWDFTIDPATYPPGRASYPDDWPRQYPGHNNYWFRPTFNDGAMARTIELMLDAGEIYGEATYRDAALRAGRFILMAQMPEPQPAWAQQYDEKLRPIWARRFEPPAISGAESQDMLFTLMRLYDRTGDAGWLEPIPRAIAWLERSQLPDGSIARFYELRTNRPLYFTKDYQLTHSDADVPTHYSFKGSSHIAELKRRLAHLSRRGPANSAAPDKRVKKPSDQKVKQVIEAIDDRGAWVEHGTLRYHKKTGPIIDSATFIRNLDILSAFVGATPAGP